MFGSRKPQKDRRGRFWDWLNPKIGQTLNGWLCGPVVGVETHWLGRTQPCRHALTGGRMRCYCQTSNLAKEWKGYVPLLDENGVQAFAIVGERFCELAFSIPMFAPVSVSRLRSAGSPVCVKQSAWTDSPPPHDAGSRKPRDIRPWLLKLWKDDELTKWFEAHPEAGDQADVPGPLESSVSAMLKGPARRVEAGADRMPATIGEVLPRVGVNGKGKH